jgi:hypothetical protein
VPEAATRIGGAVNEHEEEEEEDDGAVGNRDARYVTGFAADWLPDDDRDELHADLAS